MAFKYLSTLHPPGLHSSIAISTIQLNGVSAAALQNSISVVPDFTKDSLSSALQSYADSLKSLQTSIGSQLTNAIEPIKSFAGQSLGSVKSSIPLGKQIPSIDIADSLQALLQGVENLGGSTLSTATSYIIQVYANFKDTLPPEVSANLSDSEEKFNTIAVPVFAFAFQALKQSLDAGGKGVIYLETSLGIDPNDPLLTIVPIVAATAYLGFLYWRSVYGGYSGSLNPEQALELLRDEVNSVLVDMRPQDEREAEGIPDLRRSARFKDAAVEFQKIDQKFKKQIRNPSEVELMQMAAKIYGLKGVGYGTKVIVMDSEGNESRDIAKALQRYGFQRSYIVEGGYASWASSLRTKPDAPESSLQILKDEAEAIFEEYQPTFIQISATVFGIVLGFYALIEWEKFFQLVGVVAFGQLGYLLFTKYETAQEFQNEFDGYLSTLGVPSTLGALDNDKPQTKASSDDFDLQDSDYDSEAPKSIPESTLLPSQISSNGSIITNNESSGSSNGSSSSDTTLSDDLRSEARDVEEMIISPVDSLNSPSNP